MKRFKLWLTLLLFAGVIALSHSCKQHQATTNFGSQPIVRMDTGLCTMPNCKLKEPTENIYVNIDTGVTWISNHGDIFPDAPKAYYFEMRQIRRMFEACPTCNSLIVAFGSHGSSTSMDNVVLFLMAGIDGEAPANPTDPSHQILGYSPRYTNFLGSLEHKANTLLNQGNNFQALSFPDSGWVNPSHFQADTANWNSQTSLMGLKREPYFYYSLAPLCALQAALVKGIRCYLGIRMESASDDDAPGIRGKVHIMITGVTEDGNNMEGLHFHHVEHHGKKLQRMMAVDCGSIPPPQYQCSQQSCSTCTTKLNCPTNTQCGQAPDTNIYGCIPLSGYQWCCSTSKNQTIWYVVETGSCTCCN